VKNIGTFQQSAYGATFRQDGRLLVAGDEEARVRIFDTSTKTVLRYFKGHKGPVHRVFFTCDMLHVASYSDDKTVKLWDIPTEKAIHTFTDHTDYVRAGCVNPVSATTIMSGGYDQTVKMYDTRANECVFSVNHGSSVESVLFLPSGGIFCSAGGTEIKVWDAFAGGKLLAKISQHSKTVTCLKLASNGKRLLSGSLDRHVKFYDTTNYQTVHTMDFSSQILSLGISQNDDTFVVGMVDGLLAVHRREEDDKTPEEKHKKKRIIKRFFAADEVVPEFKMDKEAKHDHFLRKFEYAKALDVVLQKYVTSKNPQVTVAVMQELIRRKGLARAFSDRPQNTLFKIVTFFNKYIGDSRFTRVIIDAINVFLNVYEDSFDQLNPAIQKLILELAERVKNEEEISLHYLELQGSIELLMAGATIPEQSESPDTLLQATENAKVASVINVA
jgi:U3 small nucleolar RNA-associated protein 15